MFCWQGFRLYRCIECRTESVHPQPTDDELDAYYQGISGKKMVRWEQRLRKVEGAMRTYLARYRDVTAGRVPERFLDVGGGVGYYTRAAEKEGIHACLMDYAGDALKFARETLGVAWTVEGDIRDCSPFFDVESFDLVLARHTVEHMLDPERFIAGIATVLRRGGVLEIETPNAVSREQFAHPGVMLHNYRIVRASNPSMATRDAVRHVLMKSSSGVNPPKHPWGFSPAGLSSLLRKQGFEILDVHQEPAGHPVFDPLYFDLHSLSGRKGLGIPDFLWERVVTPLFAGKGTNLAILARRVRD
jgi:SAM-dependent methyltransferase